jgi:hypothetical protein
VRIEPPPQNNKNKNSKTAKQDGMTIVQLLNTDKYNRKNRFYKRYNDPVIRENGEHREYISRLEGQGYVYRIDVLNNGREPYLNPAWS